MIRIVSSLFIVNNANELLLVKEVKVDKYGLPGGKLEEGESLRQAALREGLEETGFSAIIEGLLFVTEKPLTHEGNTVLRYIYKATIPSQPNDAGELVYEYFSYEKLRELIASDSIRGADVAALIDSYYSGDMPLLPEPAIFN